MREAFLLLASDLTVLLNHYPAGIMIWRFSSGDKSNKEQEEKS